MAETTVALRRKINSAADLKSVVRTMKASAASAITQYERSVAALADYARTVELGLSACLRTSAGAPAAAVPARGRADAAVVSAIVFGSDQGLVGRFNEVVVDHALAALAQLPAKPELWAVGARAHARLVDAGLSPKGVFAVPGSVQSIAPLIGRMLLQALRPAGDPGAGALHLFYNRPQTGEGYLPVGQRLLPLDHLWRRDLASKPWPGANLPEVMGSAGTTLRTLVHEYLFVSLFRACAESLASENASRLAAMQRADRNIGELLETLNASFHRLRQGAIDEELFDLIAGFDAPDPAPSAAR